MGVSSQISRQQVATKPSKLDRGQPLPSSSSKTAFLYEPLDRLKHSIRLLTLLPDDGTAAIRLTIKSSILPEIDQDKEPENSLSTHIQDEPEGSDTYTAVSYEWGDDAITHAIQVNGEEIQIRDNLFQFLHVLLAQHPMYGFPNLWIDALCINQNDVQEQNNQVQQMQHIYSHASEVLIWIGPEKHESDRLITFFNNHSLLHCYRKFLLPFFKLATFCEEERTTWRNIGNASPSGQDFLDAQRLYEQRSLWFTYGKLRERSYWNRMWIIQEVILAQQARIICGHHSLSWTDWIIGETILFNDIHHPDRSPGRSISAIRTELEDSPAHRLAVEWRVRRLKGGVFQRNILDLVETYRTAVCANPLDRVYALLGIVRYNIHISVAYQYSSLHLVTRVLVAALVGDSSGFHVLESGTFPRRLNALLDI